MILDRILRVKAFKQRVIDLESQHIRWVEDARIREEAEQHRRHLQAFRTNLIAEASAARDSELMTQYVRRLKARLQLADAALSDVAQDWMVTAEKIAAENDLLERRATGLLAMKGVESYYGYFGRPWSNSKHKAKTILDRAMYRFPGYKNEAWNW